MKDPLPPPVSSEETQRKPSRSSMCSPRPAGALVRAAMAMGARPAMAVTLPESHEVESDMALLRSMVDLLRENAAPSSGRWRHAGSCGWPWHRFSVPGPSAERSGQPASHHASVAPGPTQAILMPAPWLMLRRGLASAEVGYPPPALWYSGT
jgi:hypothetical protein